jgi:hypothetical protein
VHQIGNSHDYELTLGLLGSIEEGSPEDRLHLFWQDSLSPKWLNEELDDIPNPNSPHLRVLPPISLQRSTLKVAGRGSSKKPVSQLALFIEDFQKRYFEAQYEIRQLELQIVDLSKKQASQSELRAVRVKIQELAEKETAWMRQLAQTLAIHSKNRSRK